MARTAIQPDQPEPVPLHIPTDSPILYGLNPEHPEINSQGLRDREIAIPKPEGELRILVLGDSVAFGTAVPADRTFPNRIEALLSKQYNSVEVINAGVSGYTAYNEHQYYLAAGRRFEPDIVIVAFCMNDVVNPRIHWGYTKEAITNIPAGAIPNHDYDQNVVLPRMKMTRDAEASSLNRESRSILDYSELFKSLEWRYSRVFRKTDASVPTSRLEVPTFITGEDSISIEVLVDDLSPENRWLRSIYDQLNGAVRADGAALVVAIFPLAYQLDENYPFFPQGNLARYCETKSIECIDLLPWLRRHHKDHVFLPKDSWHLTENGHELSAEEIVRFLHDADVINQTRGQHQGGKLLDELKAGEGKITDTRRP